MSTTFNKKTGVYTAICILNGKAYIAHGYSYSEAMANCYALLKK